MYLITQKKSYNQNPFSHSMSAPDKCNINGDSLFIVDDLPKY